MRNPTTQMEIKTNKSNDERGMKKVIELGRHRLLCGDATNKDDVALLMGDTLADLFLTDPPYGVSYIEKNAAVHGGIVKNAIGKEIKNDTQSVKDISEKTWYPAFKNGFDLSKNDASYLIFSCQGGELMMMMMMIQNAGWMVKHMLIWVKDQFVLGRCDYHYQHEPILYGWKQKERHHFYGDRKQKSVLQFKRPRFSDFHPTSKPIDLIEYLILNHTKEGDIVLDLFGGGGTTLLACERTNRRCFMMELDKNYVKVIQERYSSFQPRLL